MSNLPTCENYDFRLSNADNEWCLSDSKNKIVYKLNKQYLEGL